MRASFYHPTVTGFAHVACALLLGMGAFPAQAVGPVQLPPNAAEVQDHPQAVDLSSLSPESQGDLFMARGSYAAAIGAYQHGSLQSAVVWNKMGMAYHHLFALEEARKDYLMAITLNPHYAEALNNLAAVYHGQHNYKLAEKTYKKALKFSPDSAVTYSNLGTTYLSDEKYKLGAQAYQKAILLNPHVFDPKQAQLIDDAGSKMQRAACNYYLAKTYAVAGNTEQAITFLRRALEAGFTDRRRLLEDKDFAQLRSTPEFQQLMEELNPSHGAHHAAS